ncbi:hypothetical protein [Photorhabdus laumondii]|uniref:hypothetical protein n=1 Tax=Photorhabdus laumondii TaxID=2218628 RepID=UPI0033164ADA
MTGVSECSQQRGNLKDDGYMSLGFCLAEPYAPTKTRLTAQKAVMWDTSHESYSSFTVQS